MLQTPAGVSWSRPKSKIVPAFQILFCRRNGLVIVIARHDSYKEVGRDFVEERNALWNRGVAELVVDLGGRRTLTQNPVRRPVQCHTVLLHPFYPTVEVLRRHCDSLKVLGMKTVAVVLGIHSLEVAGSVGFEVQLCHHPWHGIDLPAECWDHEGLHHRVGC